MSNYLGFNPCDNPNYCFISYNNEDADRVSEIAQRLHHGNIPLWYDHGIDYGEAWEAKISEKLMNAQCVILFFTKNILYKEHSYVYKEYVMTTDYFDKKVYIVMMDEINNKEIPHAKVPWWIDIQSKQCINIVGVQDYDIIVKEITKAIGMATYEDKMNLIIKNYKLLYDSGKREEAELYLADYLKGMSLAGKAKCIADMFSGHLKGITIPTMSTEIQSRLTHPLINHIGEPTDSFYECQQISIDNVVFTFGNSFLFHLGRGGDAHVINIWKDETNIFTIGSLVDAYNMKVYYDSLDDIIYLVYSSQQETHTNDILDSKCYISVLTIEEPLGSTICNNFKWLVEL